MQKKYTLIDIYYKYTLKKIMYRNTANSYGLIARLFHWVISFLIISLIGVGFYMSSMQPSPEKWELYGLHKSFGVVALSLVIARIIWKFSNTAVLPIADLSNLLKWATRVTHFLLYIFMLVMPISGIMMSRLNSHDISVFGLFTIPSLVKDEALAGVFYKIHVTAVWYLIGAIILHIGGALYHHFIKKDKVLLRMLRKNI